MNNVHPLDKARRYNVRRKTVLSPRQKLLASTKNRARINGIINTLTVNDIVIPEFCPVFGYKLSQGGQEDDSPSVDRVVPSKGYVPGNVRVISMRANRLKQDGSIEDFEAILRYLRDDL